MKKNRKVLTLAMSAILCGGALVACGSTPGGGGGGGEKWNVDGPNKVKINTVNFAGGIGNKWLEDAAERFAKEMAEYTFADGKQGVYINTSYTTFYEGTGPEMTKTNNHIYFDERMSDVQQLANLDVLLSLDDIVKDTSRAGGTLESKIFESVRDGLQVEKADGKHYYGLPHYEYFGGLTYNRSVFESIGAFFVDEATSDGLYLDYPAQITLSSENMLHGRLASDYYGEDGCILSSGPDGIKGNEDDGLPRTLDEFVLLMDYIKYRGYNPVALSGAYTRYMDYTLSGLWAAFAGAEQMKNYYNCTGEIEVVKRNEQGEIEYEEEELITGIDYIKKPKTEVINMSDVDGKDGWRGNDMAAKYYAIAAMEMMYKGNFLAPHAADGGINHYDAQRDLFFGDTISTTDKSAMLIEGTYWYNETEEMASQLTLYERLTGKSRNDLDLRWMSLPTSVIKCDDLEASPASYVGKELALLDIGHAYTMINKNVEGKASLKEACLKFVGFLYGEEELVNFTKATGLQRMVNYTVSEETVNAMQPFHKSLYKTRNKNLNNIIGLSGNTRCFDLNKDKLNIALQTDCVSKDNTKPTLYSLFANYHAQDIHDMYYHTNIKKGGAWSVPAE